MKSIWSELGKPFLGLEEELVDWYAFKAQNKWTTYCFLLNVIEEIKNKSLDAIENQKADISRPEY